MNCPVGCNTNHPCNKPCIWEATPSTPKASCTCKASYTQEASYYHRDGSLATAMNPQYKRSLGGKACEFLVQPKPSMCGLGGSTEQPACSPGKNNPFL